MTQSFFEAGEHGLLVAHFCVDHTVGMQPCLRHRWSEQVAARYAP